MSQFKVKIYRCQWMVEVVIIDQYEEEQRSEPKPYSVAFKTREEAEAHRDEITEPHPYSPGRRILKDRTLVNHSYYRIGVNYREVEMTDEEITDFLREVSVNGW